MPPRSGFVDVVYKGNMTMNNILLSESSPKLGRGHDLVWMAMIIGSRNYIIV